MLFVNICPRRHCCVVIYYPAASYHSLAMEANCRVLLATCKQACKPGSDHLVCEIKGERKDGDTDGRYPKCCTLHMFRDGYVGSVMDCRRVES